MSGESIILLIPLLILVLFLVVLVIALAAHGRAGEALRKAADLRAKMRQLGADIERLQASLAERTTVAAADTPIEHKPDVRPQSKMEIHAAASEAPTVHPVPEPPIPRNYPSVQKPEPGGQVDWERFAGARLFAWVGGLALFLGISFLVKYSIEQGLISPLVRVAAGAGMGIGVILAGLRLTEKYRYTSHALCASGPAILFVTIYAACHFYHFISLSASFFLLMAVTAVMFLLAVRISSRYIALLGLVGGFLTPVLVSTGQDNPLGLFGYLALLDLGLVLVALKREWGFLVGLSALATFIAQSVWLDQFFNPTKVPAAVSIYLLFALIYGMVEVRTHRMHRSDIYTRLSAAGMPIVALLSFGFVLVWLPQLEERPGLAFLFVVSLNVLVLFLVSLEERFLTAQIVLGSATFIWILIWTALHATTANLPWALAVYLVFALVHAVFPVVLSSRRPISPPAALWANVFPLLMFVPLLVLLAEDLPAPWALWAGIFGAGAISLMIAFALGVMWVAYGVLGMMLLAFSVFLGSLENASDVMGLTLLLGLFTGGFLAASLMLEQRRGGAEASSIWNIAVLQGRSSPVAPEVFRAPILGVLMPFLLMVAAIVRLPIQNPAPLFGLALLLMGLLFGLVYVLKTDQVLPVALGAIVFLECIWHLSRFDAGHVFLSLPWYALFAGVFILFPFVSGMRDRRLVWWAAGLAAPLHFFLIYDAVVQTWGKAYIGLLPLGFAVISLFLLIWLTRILPEELAVRRALIALYAGITLFFVSLVFPLQFRKEWLTLGWALEGAALVWLYHRIPHSSLKKWAFALLLISFARLAINPAVLSYHPVQQIPVLNWYLYTYGAVITCLAAAAYLWRPPDERYLQVELRPVLYSLSAILVFLLMNIEIADFYSTGEILTFAFGRSFAQDLTYSLAWALFGLSLLLVGIRISDKRTRLAALILIAFTTLKLFFYDLWSLGQLYRVAAFVGLAVVLILVSTLYQRLISREDPKHETENVRTLH